MLFESRSAAFCLEKHRFFSAGGGDVKKNRSIPVAVLRRSDRFVGDEADDVAVGFGDGLVVDVADVGHGGLRAGMSQCA